ncbi:MAG: hypothetical protein AABX29_05065 [Nanoarchaeota archaeon]
MSIEIQEVEAPGDIQKKIECLVTNGLGYKRIPHYEDTEIGLVRHLADMYLHLLNSNWSLLFSHCLDLCDMVDACHERSSKWYERMTKVFEGIEEELTKKLV